MIYLHNGREIKTDFDYPPIPNRNFDWCAYFTDGDEYSYQGRGRTEKDAVTDLILNTEDKDD